ncbi:hypothetical protein AVEN_101108-1 [Araneus ventricosus]|uniref:Uncharacterized protein n=1 Tax=Araneus ventricosus TaxID=182803 RepID=A0A4Y2CL85_ARAVE|nr:hypothetical protein AVEN_101108-1 [Araneus ventricosus]
MSTNYGCGHQQRATSPYFKRQLKYLNRAEEAKFLPLVWASDRIEREKRITNACEAFHSKLNANFSAPNPNIYAFVEVMNSVQLARRFPLGATRPQVSLGCNSPAGFPMVQLAFGLKVFSGKTRPLPHPSGATNQLLLTYPQKKPTASDRPSPLLRGNF